MKEDYDYLFKIALIGDSGVGKTSLINRFTKETFNAAFQATIGVDFIVKTLHIGDKQVKLQFWDTAGQERFRVLSSAFYRRVDAIVLVYDITRQRTFDNLGYWLEEIEKHADSNLVKVLVGNKLDLSPQRAIFESEGRTFAQANSFSYFAETSAVDAMNLNDLMMTTANTLTERALKRDDSNSYEESRSSMVLLESGSEEKKKCCSL